MSTSLQGKTPGGSDATFQWLLHAGTDTLPPSVPQPLSLGGGGNTPLSLTATQLFVGGSPVITEAGLAAASLSVVSLTAANLIQLGTPGSPFLGSMVFCAGDFAYTIVPVGLTADVNLTLPQVDGALISTGNLSIGGNGGVDEGKPATYGADGYLACSTAFQISTVDGDTARFVMKDGSTPTAFYWTLSVGTALTANRTVIVPDKAGTLAVLPTFANDAAAATGGLSIGDIYLSTATGRFRARTA